MATVFTHGYSSPHSSVQEWLQQVTLGTPPPTPTMVTSQAVSELPIGATACALAPKVQEFEAFLLPRHSLFSSQL